jgi:3-hydroxyisobutyrate dehydrogenase-like beta-hydroxyacid dehydrogenase
MSERNDSAGAHEGTGYGTVGFIGVGRLGLPFALNLLRAGYDVVGTSRGHAEDLVAAGGRIAGDGSSAAVAAEAQIVFTCLPDDAALEAVVDGVLSAEGTAPTVIELSTVSIEPMERLAVRLSECGGDLLDCPVSGTPAMAAEKQAVVFASGDRAGYERVTPLIAAIAPINVFVGDLGAGTNFKYVANLLAFVHVTAAAEAMAFAKTAGLDLNLVAAVISKSAGATSGQFNIRAPMMAAGNFDSKLVTVNSMREVAAQIVGHAEKLGASTPLITVVRDLYEEFAAQGEGESDPGKLVLYLAEQASAHSV